MIIATLADVSRGVGFNNARERVGIRAAGRPCRHRLPTAGFAEYVRAVRREWPVAAAIGVAFPSWGEWLNWRWSRTLVSNRQYGAVAVVIPGFRNPQPTANMINRWRTRIALRSVNPHDQTATLIFSGGTVGNGRAEADLMAEYASSNLTFSGRTLREDQSRTSWENVSNVLPLIENADRIVIASHPAHALKIRAYAGRQRLELAERLARGGDYRFGERAPLKPFLALYGLWALRGLQPAERRIS